MKLLYSAVCLTLCVPEFGVHPTQLLSVAQLDEYQEQAHLLDPFLEQLVEPVVAKIRHYAQSLNTNNADDPTNLARIERVALLLYSYVKSRGYKTISQPLSICSILQQFMHLRVQSGSSRTRLLISHSRACA
jgi:hypothetical protein